jgi:hypothetical protein
MRRRRVALPDCEKADGRTDGHQMRKALARGVWSVRSYRYLGLNFVGGWGLSAAAALSHQRGFGSSC